MANDNKKPDNKTTDIAQTPTEDLFNLIRQGNKTTITDIRDSVTAPLIQYSLKLISEGDLKRSDQIIKLIDLVHRHSVKEVKVKDDLVSYITFLDESK
jgi:hypothetical protein